MKQRQWNRGDKVVCNGNHQATVLDHYGGGMYNVRLFDGFRHVGDCCVDGSTLRPLDEEEELDDGRSVDQRWMANGGCRW